MKWGDEQTIKFIRLYQMNTCLWDSRTPDYKVRETRNEALDNIIAKMNIPNFGHAECKNKIKNIRSQYYQELKKIRLSIKRGGKVYCPSVPWFNALDKFLKNIVVHRRQDPYVERETPLERTSPDVEFIDYTIIKDDLDDDETEYEILQEEASDTIPDQGVDVSTSTVQGEHGGGGLNAETEGLRLLTSAIQKIDNVVMNNSATSATSEFDVFGQSVAAQLKSMPFQDALRLQLEIQQLITNRRISQHYTDQ